jgi:hypothetical protein
MNEEKLQEIERGMERWSVCSPDTARILIAEIRRLRGALDRVWTRLDDSQSIIEQAQGKLK